MRWIRRWSNRRQALPNRPHRRLLQADPQTGETDVPPRGCAWFDSSHELMRGLEVVEVGPLPQIGLPGLSYAA